MPAESNTSAALIAQLKDLLRNLAAISPENQAECEYALKDEMLKSKCRAGEDPILMIGEVPLTEDYVSGPYADQMMNQLNTAIRSLSTRLTVMRRRNTSSPGGVASEKK